MEDKPSVDTQLQELLNWKQLMDPVTSYVRDNFLMNEKVDIGSRMKHQIINEVCFIQLFSLQKPTLSFIFTVYTNYSCLSGLKMSIDELRLRTISSGVFNHQS